MKALSMNDVDLAGKRVVMRLDLNVPMKNGVISSDKRIRAVLPTIRLALDRGACVIALSHLGRPVEGEFDERVLALKIPDAGDEPDHGQHNVEQGGRREERIHTIHLHLFPQV